MIRKSSEIKTNRIDGKFGGAGYVEMASLISGNEELNNKGRVYSRITIQPGNEFGYHEHHGESEIYYILSGTGLLSDNGNLVQVEAGDVAFTPDGHGHSIKNNGTEPLEIMALVLFV